MRILDEALQLGLTFHCWPLPVLPGELTGRARAMIAKRTAILLSPVKGHHGG